MPEAPLPPLELMHRVGRIEDEPDVPAAYEAIGRRCRERLERVLPDDWSWEGKRVLDFGCGAGRTLRHFLAEAERGELHGCDIDHASIAWLQEHLAPPLHVFENGELPPLPQPNAYFDLAYAFSVFTHLADHWARWLLELHRVLKRRGRASADPRGLAAARFNVEQLHWEAAELAVHHAALRSELDTIANSRSWKLTAPLRAARGLLRKSGG